MAAADQWAAVAADTAAKSLASPRIMPSTPSWLAVLISATEVALSRDRPVDEFQDVLTSQLEDLRARVNLVTNATRCPPDGEAIVVRLDAADGSTRVSVSNPGPPIPKETLLRRFDRLWRSDAARARSSEGHGIGLAIVRAVAQMHGGGTSDDAGRGSH